MVIRGDLIELIDDNVDPDMKTEEIDNTENISWKFNSDEPIPIEIFFVIFCGFWKGYYQ